MRYEKGVFLVIVTLQFCQFFSKLLSMIQRLNAFVPQALSKKNLNRGGQLNFSQYLDFQEIKLIFDDLI
jgi:hypothetical protein